MKKQQLQTLNRWLMAGVLFAASAALCWFPDVHHGGHWLGAGMMVFAGIAVLGSAPVSETSRSDSMPPAADAAHTAALPEDLTNAKQPKERHHYDRPH